jgi:putative RecB family exonuclease
MTTPTAAGRTDTTDRTTAATTGEVDATTAVTSGGVGAGGVTSGGVGASGVGAGGVTSGGVVATADDVAEAALPSLSPSRAADFKTCPLLYRLRAIDRVPEPPSADRARGTLVHAVLERLFDLPAGERTPAAAAALVDPQWQRLVGQEPELVTLLDGEDGGRFLASARELLAGYFTVEDPRRIEPGQRECLIETVVGGGLLLRGYVDRLDVSPQGQLRVVDYKSGGAPREAFEARALFQLKFYALVLWRSHGAVPRVLRLLYLKDAEICDYTPEAEELRRFERTLVALWRAIETATTAQHFRPTPSRLCDWCSYQHLCPAFGGTPPPFPQLPPDSLVHVPEPRPGADD